MVRVLSRRMQALFGVTQPNAWSPPAMLGLTVATYAVAFGLVFMLFFTCGPSPGLRRCLTDPTMGGVSLLSWISIVNAGWAGAVVTDAIVRLHGPRVSTADKVRSGSLAILGLGIVAGMQLAVEALRLVAASDDLTKRGG